MEQPATTAEWVAHCKDILEDAKLRMEAVKRSNVESVPERWAHWKKGVEALSFQLFDDRVAVIADEVEEVAPSGLILTESAQTPLRYGTIANVGTGHVSDQTGQPVPINCSAGDKVFWHRASGQPLTIAGVEYVILQPREIIGFVE
jgi:co-chaperonin GroES (HSP10)